MKPWSNQPISNFSISHANVATKQGTLVV